MQQSFSHTKYQLVPPPEAAADAEEAVEEDSAPVVVSEPGNYII